MHGLGLALGSQRCTTCFGKGRLVDFDLCDCVYRKIARAVLAAAHRSPADPMAWARGRSYQFSAPRAEYRADVKFAMRRTLIERDATALRCRRIDERDCNEGVRVLSISKGNYFHSLYRAEVRFGREALRVGLYPPPRYLTEAVAATDQAKCLPHNRKSPPQPIAALPLAA